MNILCTICVRKGSKGLKDKNIKKLLGTPLIFHSINQAKKSKIFNKIIVSTDSQKIINLVNKKVDLVINRPKSLSKDDTGKVTAIRHALKSAEKSFNKLFDVVVDLDVTSPLRTKEDIIKALKLFKRNNNLNLISITRSKKNPYFNMVEIVKDSPLLVKKINKKVLSRQQAPKVFELNASIYIWKRNYLLSSNNIFSTKTGVYLMPEKRSIDIDNELDFKIVEFLMKKKL